MLIDVIRNNNAIAACYILVKYNAMAGFQKVTNSNNDKINKGEITSNKQEISTIAAAEGLILLNLIYYIYVNTKGVIVGSIKVYTNNYKIAKGMNKKVFKTTEYATDGLASISKIRQLL